MNTQLLPREKSPNFCNFHKKNYPQLAVAQEAKKNSPNPVTLVSMAAIFCRACA
jgi:hypothetical protein